MTPPALRQALLNLSVGKATSDEVMRALFSHEDWFVPAHLVPAADPPVVHDSGVVVGGTTAPQTDRLFLFTDREAAQRAGNQGKSLGLFTGGVSSDVVISIFGKGFKKLVVNPLLPQEEGFFIEAGGLVWCEYWRDVEQLERIIATLGRQGPDPAQVRALHGYRRFTLWGKSDGSTVQFITLNGWDGQFAVGWTAHDHREAFEAFLQKAEGRKIEHYSLPGSALFSSLHDMPQCAGIALNPNSSLNPVITRESFEQLAASP